MKNSSILRTVIVLALLSLAVSTAISFYLENQELRENAEGSKEDGEGPGNGESEEDVERKIREDEDDQPKGTNKDDDREKTEEGKSRVNSTFVYAKSTSGSFLYSECLNKIELKTGGSEGYDYGRVVANKSTVIWGSKTGYISVVPSGENCIMEVYSLQNKNSSPVLIDTFGVVEPPLPHLELMVNGKVYNGISPIPKSSKCNVRIVADEGFNENYGNDASYGVSRVELYAQRSLGAPNKVGTYSGNGKNAEKGIQVNLGKKLEDDSPGTKIYFKVDEVYRINYKNKRIEVPLSENARVLGAVIK